MNERDDMHFAAQNSETVETIQDTESMPAQTAFHPELLHELFQRLNPRDVEQFHKSYQLWSLQQLRAALVEQIATLRQKSVENGERMRQTELSALSLANLAQLQACGVEDVDLLDIMLARGDTWLDHTIQLLERCERLDLIGGDYTEWCQHALEGAYDWLDSMSESGAETARAVADDEETAARSQITEELLLRKLMSEEDEEETAPSMPALSSARITHPLPPLEESTEAELIERSEVGAPGEESEILVFEDALQEQQEVTAEPTTSEVEVLGEDVFEETASVLQEQQEVMSEAVSLPLAAYASIPALVSVEAEEIAAGVEQEVTVITDDEEHHEPMQAEREEPIAGMRIRESEESTQEEFGGPPGLLTPVETFEVVGTISNKNEIGDKEELYSEGEGNGEEAEESEEAAHVASEEFAMESVTTAAEKPEEIVRVEAEEEETEADGITAQVELEQPAHEIPDATEPAEREEAADEMLDVTIHIQREQEQAADEVSAVSAQAELEQPADEALEVSAQIEREQSADEATGINRPFPQEQASSPYEGATLENEQEGNQPTVKLAGMGSRREEAVGHPAASTSAEPSGRIEQTESYSAPLKGNGVAEHKEAPIEEQLTMRLTPLPQRSEEDRRNEGNDTPSPVQTVSVHLPQEMAETNESGKNEIEERKEKKPQEVEAAPKRGFFQRSLAKIWRR